jgi:sortase (surface protein transpeptidase)
MGYDDLIRFTTPGGDYAYRVVSMTVVSPENSEVLLSGGSESLTRSRVIRLGFWARRREDL